MGKNRTKDKLMRISFNQVLLAVALLSTSDPVDAKKCSPCAEWPAGESFENPEY